MPRTDRGSLFARRAHADRLALGVFAGALAVLVLNDWVFKGQGILPGWLTGKLSDFAGLIVAPVCLASCLAARRRRTQLCCIAAVAIVFALTEVSPACAAMLEQLLRGVGLPWRLWPDLGDLWALGVLPLGWFCCRALSSPTGARSSAGRVARWLTLPACLACLASGTETFSARAYVYNATGAMAYVEVSSAWVDCEALAAYDYPFLETRDFVSEGSFQLEPGTVLPIAFWPAGGSSLTRGDCMCALHRVSAAGRTVNVALQGLGSVDFLKTPDSDDLKEHRGQLVTLRAGSEPIQVGSRLGTFELALTGAGSSEASCPSAEGPSLDVSLPPARDLEQTGPDGVTSFEGVPILSLTPIAGNCFELAFGYAAAVEPLPAAAAADAGDAAAAADAGDAAADAGDAAVGAQAPDRLPPARVDAARMQICAPLELFPFQAGERVRWQRAGLDPTEPTRETLEIRNERAHLRLMRGVYYRGSPSSDWQDFWTSLPAVRCGPLRDTDGALFEPIDVAYGWQALVPGRAVRIADTNHQIYLGRARRHLGRACGTDESWIEVMETWTY